MKLIRIYSIRSVRGVVALPRRAAPPQARRTRMRPGLQLIWGPSHRRKAGSRSFGVGVDVLGVGARSVQPVVVGDIVRGLPNKSS